MKITEDRHKQLRQVCDHYDLEDRAIRERAIRFYKRNLFYWDGLTNLFWSETAHDWRVFDANTVDDSAYQDFYDKRVNVYKAYLESIIAALSVVVPPVVCYPDDADNVDDLETAKAGNVISKLVYRHNDVTLTWLHALFIYCTQGLIATYNYTHESDEYGEVDKPKYETQEEEITESTCSICGMPIEQDPHDVFDAEVPNINICMNCGYETIPSLQTIKVPVTRQVGVTKEPKSRQCIKSFGGLFVKIASYAKTQKETPYLRLCEDIHYSFAVEEFDHLRDKIVNSSGGLTLGNTHDSYELWARIPTLYQGAYPENTVVKSKYWLRPCSFNILPKDECAWWQKTFPSGVKCCWINDLFGSCEDESLDDHWTLTHNPLSNYLQHDPLGNVLISLQDITNDIVSLAIQTMEHGISTTFADPGVLDFNAYRNSEVLPGAVIPTKQTSKPISDGFYDLKTTTFSSEFLPFGNVVQEFAQLTSGAQPSLFGGEIDGSKTAAQYSMSRAQALQRLQTPWKMLCAWWRQIFGKVIPAYIENVAEDERHVEKDKTGRFVNIFVRLSQLRGKIGHIELEASEQLPISWQQQKDTIMQMLQTKVPGLFEALTDPSNIPVVKEAMGLERLTIPGEDDREKQLEEIQMLLNSEPIIGQKINEETGIPEESEMPSVDIEPIIDNNEIHADIVRLWAVSAAGRLAKIENPQGYKNVLLHGSRHIEVIQALTRMNAVQSQEPNNNQQPEQQNTEAQNEPANA